MAVRSRFLCRVCPQSMQVWMSHGDRVERLPAGFPRRSRTATIRRWPRLPTRARQLYGIQFHPEVVHTPQGAALLANFVKRICGCAGDWTPGNFYPRDGRTHPAQVGPDGHVICGLSGGVDSAPWRRRWSTAPLATG